MPKIRSLRSKPPPAGFDDIQEALNEFEQKMREAESESPEGKRKCELTWPVTRVNHQRSRFVFELYFKNREISRELFDYLIKEGWADSALIAKWKKPGFDHLCCLKCASTSAHTHGSTCICRVPKNQLEPGQIVECTNCGCRGCA